MEVGEVESVMGGRRLKIETTCGLVRYVCVERH